MNRALNIACILLFLGLFPLGSNAQELAPADSDEEIYYPGCDYNLYNIHVNRAFLEATRQNLYDKTFIHKPDSVLEYTCFQPLVMDTAEGIAGIFSSTDHWANTAIPTSYGSVPIDVFRDPELYVLSLELYVFYYITSGEDVSFLQTNFAPSYENAANHFLGGSGPAPPLSVPCSVMATVWESAKCENFPRDQWHTFDDLVVIEPREWPMLCDTPAPITDAIIERSRKANKESAGFSKLAGNQMYYYEYLRAETACEHQGVEPIFTGVTAHVTFEGEIMEYPDAFCVVPGCSYINPAYEGPGECSRAFPTGG